MTHQHGGESGYFDRSVPSVDVIAGIGFGNTNGRAIGDGFLESLALRHAVEQQVGTGVEDTAKTDQAGTPQWVAEERENWRTIHHRRLKAKAQPLPGSQFC